MTIPTQNPTARVPSPWLAALGILAIAQVCSVLVSRALEHAHVSTEATLVQLVFSGLASALALRLLHRAATPLSHVAWLGCTVLGKAVSVLLVGPFAAWLTSAALIGTELVFFCGLVVCAWWQLHTQQLLFDQQNRQLGLQRTELDRLALVAQRSSHAVVITDAQHRIVWANHCFARICGQEPQEDASQTLQSILLGPHTDPAKAAALHQALHNGESISLQLLVQTDSGDVRGLDVDIQPLDARVGEAHCFIAFISDVTGQMTQGLQFSSILEALPCGVVVHSSEGLVVECNPMAERIMGISRENYLRKDWATACGWRLVHEDLSEIAPEDYPGLLTLRTQRPILGKTYGLAMPDGRMRWITSTTQVIRDAVGGLCGVVSCLVDVTGARAQQDLLALAVDGEGVGTWQAETASGEMTCNDQFYHMLGCHRNDIPNQLSMWEQRIHPKDVALWRETLRTHLSHPTLPFRCELRVQNRDGSWASLMVNGTTLERNEDGTSKRIAGVNVDITEQKGLRTQLINSERTDNLTQLPNRIVALERVQQVLERTRGDPEQQFAVLHIDADRFKQVNDTLGHSVGDSLLRLIANRLKNTLRPNDAISRFWGEAQTAARIGGDEFVVVLEGLRQSEDVYSVAQRLLETLTKPYLIEGNPIHLTVSIGVVTREHSGQDAQTILRDADIAMYEAKRTGRGRIVLFEPDMHSRVTERASLEADLRSALQRDELFVVYQPVLCLRTGTTSGVEALVRWRHPTRGLVSPVEFIAVAEETGLIGNLGNFVLAAACKHFMQWQRNLQSLAPRTLAVNLSRAQLSLPSLIDDVRRILTETSMQPFQLQLEVTESLAAQDEVVQYRLRELKALGVTLALDDFGTGYSSLACLHLMPVDTVKIDRSFVGPSETSSHHRVLIEATIRVAQSLGMSTVAEGVESPGQAQLLASMHCDKVQGYFYSKPLPADELLQWLLARAQSNNMEAVA